MARRTRTRLRDVFSDFEPSQPLPAEGGIRAQSRRGAFAGQWWGRRWIAALEAFHVGARLTRGRAYARQGQVVDLRIEKGLIRARVQGSRPRPYRVEIRLQAFSPQQWQAAGRVLAAEARFAAALLAGEMPPEIEPLLAAAGLSLFPGGPGDLQTECSCPDWVNPCKHVAAVYYLVAEALDADPFLLFTLRGLTREELLALVHAHRPEAGTGRSPDLASPSAEAGSTAGDEVERAGLSIEATASAPLAGPGDLPGDPASFWQGGPLPTVEVRRAPARALLRRLGPIPFWRGSVPPTEALESIYRAAAGWALELGRYLAQSDQAPGLEEAEAGEAGAADGPRRRRRGRDPARG